MNCLDIIGDFIDKIIAVSVNILTVLLDILYIFGYNIDTDITEGFIWIIQDFFR